MDLVTNSPNDSSTAAAVAAAGAAADAAAGQPTPDPLLSPEQRDVVAAALRGESIFVTGEAGAGKSVALRAVIVALKRQYPPGSVAVTASTAIAALPLGGCTLHAWAGCGVPASYGDFKSMLSNRARKRISETRVLVIDEISMVSGEFFDALDDVASFVRCAFGGAMPARRGTAGAARAPDKPMPDLPFGGIQLVLCGDFAQLPPVVTKEAQDAVTRHGGAWRRNEYWATFDATRRRRTGSATAAAAASPQRALSDGGGGSAGGGGGGVGGSGSAFMSPSPSAGRSSVAASAGLAGGATAPAAAGGGGGRAMLPPRHPPVLPVPAISAAVRCCPTLAAAAVPALGAHVAASTAGVAGAAAAAAAAAAGASGGGFGPASARTATSAAGGVPPLPLALVTLPSAGRASAPATAASAVTPTVGPAAVAAQFASAPATPTRAALRPSAPASGGIPGRRGASATASGLPARLPMPWDAVDAPPRDFSGGAKGRVFTCGLPLESAKQRDGRLFSALMMGIDQTAMGAEADAANAMLAAAMGAADADDAAASAAAAEAEAAAAGGCTGAPASAAAGAGVDRGYGSGPTGAAPPAPPPPPPPPLAPPPRPPVAAIAMPLTRHAAAAERISDLGDRGPPMHGQGFAFESWAWVRARLRVCALTRVFRQAGAGGKVDAPLLAALGDVRRGIGGSQKVRGLIASMTRALPHNEQGIKPTELYSKRV